MFTQLKKIKSSKENVQNMMENNKKKAMDFLFNHSFKYDPKPIFPLASGKMSNYYIDCKTAFSFPEARALFAELLLDKLSGVKAVAIGGLLVGAYPLAIGVSDALYKKTKTSLRVFIVRKEGKPHGLKKTVEGKLNSGDRVIIVDDVVTSGRSTIDAINKSRAVGLEIVKVIALIDRQEENGREKIEECQVNFESIFTLDDFKSRLRNEQRPKTVAG